MLMVVYERYGRAGLTALGTEFCNATTAAGCGKLISIGRIRLSPRLPTYPISTNARIHNCRVMPTFHCIVRGLSKSVAVAVSVRRACVVGVTPEAGFVSCGFTNDAVATMPGAV